MEILSVKKKSDMTPLSELNLPKGRLSWSQMSLWMRSKEYYRRDYYENRERPATPEMRFGSALGKLMELGIPGPVLDRIPRFSVPEFRLETSIEGVPVLGFIDSYDPSQKRFIEYKTGRRKEDGSAPWDAGKVRGHGQLTLYMAMLEAQEGGYYPECRLVWIETERRKRKEEIDGIEFDAYGPLQLTGHVEVFLRLIRKWEVKRMRKMVRTVAEEISADYTAWRKEYGLA